MKLENKVIGKNIARFRKMREMKPSDIAKQLGMKEAAYTKYEKGESPITIELVQKIAETLKIDPFQILSTAPVSIADNIHNSPAAGVGNYIGGNLNIPDEQQSKLLLKMMENIITLMEKMVVQLDKK